MKVFSILICSFILFTVLVQPGFSEDFPSKPIKIIVPFPVGGSADISTRRIAALAAQQLGQPIIIDNRPGAAGNIGTALAAKSPPDGYTLTYFVRTTMTLNPHIYINPGFDALKDFDTIIISYKGPALLVVKADSPIGSVSDLIREAKRQPGQLRYASGGVGSPQYLFMERLKKVAGLDLLHIPYKGDAQFLPDVMSGQVEVTFSFPATALPLVNAGKLRALAVSSKHRFLPLPDVPTLAEAGLPAFDEIMWAGFAAPAKIAPERLRKIHAALQFALRSPEIKTYLDSIGYEAVAGTPEEAAAQLKTDYERDGKIAKELGLQLE
jgi:tripartite-type tricarboxylate transporter receptor subunit TctC